VAGKSRHWTDPAAHQLLGQTQTTNNIAEYLAAIECLRQIYRLPWRGPVVLRGDSQLVVHQYNGIWRCNSSHLLRLLKHLKTAAGDFPSVNLAWVPREQNQLADAQARQAYRHATGQEPPTRRTTP
jgi:probable phosphoglycerate mutase